MSRVVEIMLVSCFRRNPKYVEGRPIICDQLILTRVMYREGEHQISLEVQGAESP